MTHIEQLNKAQREAVLHKEGPLLIIAGAGAGKTRTIAHRIFNLINQGIEPRNILAITFTNKAAQEMKERISALLTNSPPAPRSSLPFVSTFHALGAYILRENAQAIGLNRHFSILDKDDSLSVVKSVIKELELDPKQFEPRRMLNSISKQKGELIDADSYSTSAKEFFPRVLSSVWLKYEEQLKKQKGLDFDDLILKTVQLFQKNEKVREYYQALWKYIHIDEYQDTNKAQYELARILSVKHKNICVVGDVDQSIYGWRGADFRNILDFEKDYNEIKVTVLEENYRSTQNILSAANAVIAKNKFRKEKNIFTQNKEGDKISVFEALNAEEEADFVSETSGKLIHGGVSPSEIAVLYRANFQSRTLEDSFLKNDVSYQVLGVKFFERKEIKDVLAFVKVGLNPDDRESLKRVINIPPRGIGKTTLLKIFSNKENELPIKMQEKIKQFRALLDLIKEAALNQKPSAVIKFVMQKTGLEEALRKGTEEEKERLENIRELVTLASKYDELPVPEGMEKLLTEAVLVSDQDSLSEQGNPAERGKKKEKNGVKLMTVHAAKGLEFGYVFIVGLEDGLFPHSGFGDPPAGGQERGEEERRLFYVALTRAKEKLFLTFANTRTIFGSKQINTPSEFLSDIPEDLVEIEENDGMETIEVE